MRGKSSNLIKIRFSLTVTVGGDLVLIKLEKAVAEQLWVVFQ